MKFQNNYSRSLRRNQWKSTTVDTQLSFRKDVYNEQPSEEFCLRASDFVR